MKLKPVWKITAIALCIAFPVIAVTPPATTSLVIAGSAGSTADDVIDRYSKTEPRSAEDYFTLAVAQFGKTSVKEALESANRALPLFADAEKKALCYQLIAQCYGALGDYKLAARAATDGQQVLPDSRDLAALRVAYFKQMGDELNFTIASEHLMRLDPVYRKDPKCDPVTGAIIIVGLICMTVIAVKNLDSIDKAQDAETRQNLAKAFEHIWGLAFSLAMLSTPLPKGSK